MEGGGAEEEKRRMLHKRGRRVSEAVCGAMIGSDIHGMAKATLSLRRKSLLAAACCGNVSVDSNYDP